MEDRGRPVRVVLHIDPAQEPERARRAWESHLRRVSREMDDLKPCGKHGKQPAMACLSCCVPQRRFTVGGPAAMVDPSRHSSCDRQGLRHKLIIFMQNRSTPDYWFEKAHQCFRRSRTDSNVRHALEALGNAFMVKAVELDIKLQKLANDNNSTASPPARAGRYGQAD